MKKIALLMASAAVAAVISGCTAMQYAPDELKWTTKHSDDEIYGKAVDCATSMLGTPQNGEQFFVYESDKLHKFTTKSWVQIRPNPILTAWYRSDKGRPAAPLGAGGQQHDRGCC